MTRILITIFLLTFWLTSFGQEIKVDTLIITKIEDSTNIQNQKLKFPVLKTGNLQIDTALNMDLKNRFTNNAYPDISSDSALIRFSEGIVYLDFEVTYIKNGLISLNINAESYGAYSTEWTEFFTYNYLTGQFVTIDQIIDTSGHFKSLVVNDKNIQYEQQKKELKELYLDKNDELHLWTYMVALELYESCEKKFTIKSFALHTDYLEIIENCSLPNIIKNLTPIIVLKYNYVDIKKDLKINSLE